jgi:hypothetical protein
MKFSVSSFDKLPYQGEFVDHNGHELNHIIEKKIKIKKLVTCPNKISFFFKSIFINYSLCVHNYVHM